MIPYLTKSCALLKCDLLMPSNLRVTVLVTCSFESKPSSLSEIKCVPTVPSVSAPALSMPGLCSDGRSSDVSKY